MKKTIWRNRIWLAILAGILLVAPAAFAQESLPEEPAEAEATEEETSGVWVVDWILNPDGVSYTIEYSDASLNTTVQVVDTDGDGIDHGDHVRSFQEAVPKGPGRGCIISQVARSDAGKPEVDEETEETEANRGCPEGLYEWLNSDDRGSGPPPWAGGPNGDDDSDDVEAASGRPAHAGPPAGVGGPP